ncbi:MAG TPA: MFS transporter [Candidatus Limnocylindria bacterium]|nr:MFS transporter [Candidatus Limnocylindria bacterium]
MRSLPGLAPLAHRNYALYWVGQLVSMSGTWIELTATTWLLYQLTDSPLLLGLGGVFRAAPLFAFALIGGTVADRVERRRLLLITQSASVATSLVLGALVVSGQIAFWHIYAINLLNAIIAAFDAPGRQSLFPTLVPRGQLQNAITLNAMLFRTSNLVGPAVAGLLIARVGVAAPFFVNAVSYFAIIAGLLAMRIPAAADRPRGSIRDELVGGLRYVRASTILPLVLAIEASLSIFGHNQALVTIFARDVLGTDAEGLGLLLSSIGAGAIAGMVLLVAVGDVRRKGAFMLGAGALYAAMLLVFAWSRSFGLSMAVLALLGFADATWGTMRNAIAQLAADDVYRGRVMSLFVIVSRGLTNASQLQTGAVTALVGAPGAATIGALIIAGVVGTVAARVERLRHFTAPATLRPAPEAAQAGGE